MPKQVAAHRDETHNERAGRRPTSISVESLWQRLDDADVHMVGRLWHRVQQEGQDAAGLRQALIACWSFTAQEAEAVLDRAWRMGPKTDRAGSLTDRAMPRCRGFRDDLMAWWAGLMTNADPLAPIAPTAYVDAFWERFWADYPAAMALWQNQASVPSVTRLPVPSDPGVPGPLKGGEAASYHRHEGGDKSGATGLSVAASITPMASPRTMPSRDRWTVEQFQKRWHISAAEYERWQEDGRLPAPRGTRGHGRGRHAYHPLPDVAHVDGETLSRWRAQDRDRWRAERAQQAERSHHEQHRQAAKARAADQGFWTSKGSWWATLDVSVPISLSHESRAQPPEDVIPVQWVHDTPRKLEPWSVPGPDLRQRIDAGREPGSIKTLPVRLNVELPDAEPETGAGWHHWPAPLHDRLSRVDRGALSVELQRRLERAFKRLMASRKPIQEAGWNLRAQRREARAKHRADAGAMSFDPMQRREQVLQRMAEENAWRERVIVAWQACLSHPHTLDELTVGHLERVGRAAQEKAKAVRPDLHEPPSKRDRAATDPGGNPAQTGRRRRKASGSTALAASRPGLPLDVDALWGVTWALARTLRRTWTVITGPTNAGKTHAALQALQQAATGVYLAPLRLLALEVYERLTRQGVVCDLITGEERRQHAGATHVCATVEMFDPTRSFDVAVIDEGQLLDDPKRGHAWAAALAGVGARHVMALGEPGLAQRLRPALERWGEPMTETTVVRKTPLQVIPHVVGFAKVEPGDAIVVFSRHQVMEVASRLRAAGRSVAMIYGMLPPSVRQEQAERFEQGVADVLVATDAIGMGLNLPIRRVLFDRLDKFDGEQVRPLTDREIRQIGGRAGRFGYHDAGWVGAFREDVRARLSEVFDADRCGAALVEEKWPLLPSWEAVQRIAQGLNTASLYETLHRFMAEGVPAAHPVWRAHVPNDVLEKARWADAHGEGVPLRVKWGLAMAPMAAETLSRRSVWFDVLRAHQTGSPLRCRALPAICRPGPRAASVERLAETEAWSREIGLYLWCAHAFPEVCVDADEARRQQALLHRCLQAWLPQTIEFVSQERPRSRRVTGRR